MTLGINQSVRVGALPVKPGIYTSAAQIVLARLMEVIRTRKSHMEMSEETLLGVQGDPTATNFESRYLDWATEAFSSRDIWPSGAWMQLVFKETQRDLIQLFDLI